MYVGSRIAAASLLGSALVMGLGVGVLIEPDRDQPQAWDDVSDYDGTKCPLEELYDATDGRCASDTISSIPDAFDDISNFGGTNCSADQFYDATDGKCATTAATNDPDAPLQPDSVGISDPGRDCAETQFFSVPDMKCMPDLVTNENDTVVKPEGEDPTAYTAPKVTNIPNCAGGTDPLSMCSQPTAKSSG